MARAAAVRSTRVSGFLGRKGKPVALPEATQPSAEPAAAVPSVVGNANAVDLKPVRTESGPTATVTELIDAGPATVAAVASVVGSEDDVEGIEETVVPVLPALVADPVVVKRKKKKPANPKDVVAEADPVRYTGGRHACIRGCGRD